MFQKSYSQEEFDKILSQINSRSGWDFSIMKTERQIVPWDYLEIITRYLKINDSVLDIGTGGGEKFLKLADKFKNGVGVDIDPEMIKAATENAKDVENVEFFVDTEKLENTPDEFNVILCRHAPYDLEVVFNHLKKGGYFIMQQVGEKNMLNIKEVLSGPDSESLKTPALEKNEIESSKLSLIAFMEYDVEYIVKDVESLVFWLNALDMLHSDLSGGSALETVEVFNKILEGNVDEKGFITNEHRYLTIAQK